MSHTFHSWSAKEYEKKSKTKRWYLVATIILCSIILYALLTNNPIMAVTFILIGVVGYLLLENNPRKTRFTITSDGIQAGSELYEYENIQSFWIFYEPGHLQAISLHTKSGFVPFIKIPLGDEDPVELRETLIKYVPEKKHKENLIDIIENFF